MTYRGVYYKQEVPMFKYQTWIVILKHTTWSLLADIAYDSWRGQMILKTTRAVLLYIIWM